MPKNEVSVVSPGAYAVSDGAGEIQASRGQGLFYRDARHLSKFVLKVNGASPEALGCRTRGSEAEFSLTALAGATEGGISVARRRSLGAGMQEEIRFANETGGPVEVRVELECEADFRDVFEVRGYKATEERGALTPEAQTGHLRFLYQRGEFRRGTVVRVSDDDVEPLSEPGVVSFSLRLGPGEERGVSVSVTLEEDGEEVRLVPRSRGLYADAPALASDWQELKRAWEKSVEDLESLAFDVGDGLLVPAAGAPWYMALFGRDSLITAYQTMLLGPEPARNTLRALARYQATGRDDFTDAEPGKILHELRAGELARFGKVPHSPYYGTADATPLFLVLLHEVWRWTADVELVQDMEGTARQALAWVLDHSDKIGDGYVAYTTRSNEGLRNQGWKDHFDSMLFRDGTPAEGPVAPCEVQGYVYDALRRTAGLAEKVWEDAALAADLCEKARDLKERFDRDYWMEDRGYYALALDGEGRQVDSVTSNPGHLLWSGLVPPGKARAVADRLMSREMFSGWGVRTMADWEGGYDPDSYHNGSVWPHDTSLIAYGLRRYGFRREANRIVGALLEAAPHFGYRLPEVFGGYSREKRRAPVEYPTSCSPQAWAAGTVPLLARAMLGVEPDPDGRKLRADPFLPECVEDLHLDGVSAFGERRPLGA